MVSRDRRGQFEQLRMRSPIEYFWSFSIARKPASDYVRLGRLIVARELMPRAIQTRLYTKQVMRWNNLRSWYVSLCWRIVRINGSTSEALE